MANSPHPRAFPSHPIPPHPTLLQIAMLGGQVRGKGAAPAAPGPALPPGAKADAAKQRSQAMGVSEFLDKGVGAALMPRKAQVGRRGLRVLGRGEGPVGWRGGVGVATAGWGRCR